MTAPTYFKSAIESQTSTDVTTYLQNLGFSVYPRNSANLYNVGPTTYVYTCSDKVPVGVDFTNQFVVILPTV